LFFTQGFFFVLFIYLVLDAKLHVHLGDGTGKELPSLAYCDLPAPKDGLLPSDGGGVDPMDRHTQKATVVSHPAVSCLEK